MAFVWCVTHPQVRISADIPVPLWGLSDIGRARAEAFAKQPWLANTQRILSSAETKALETAAIAALRLGVAIEVREALHENDRSSTGFVPPAEFEVLADAFFGSPDSSVRGWETSRAAQHRVVAATSDLFNTPAQHDVLIVAHGAVGTLLLCHLLGVPISRSYDQVGGDAARGGGNYWAFDTTTRQVVHHWRPFDAP